MIRINLLPVRAAKRKETARQQIIVSLGAIAILVLLSFLVYSYLMVKISSAKEEISRSEQEIAELKAKIEKIKDIEKLKAEVQKKLDVLSQLRREKTGPVQRLQTLSQSVQEKIWLTNYAENGTQITINGIAFNEELIAAFMKSIEASTDFEKVELIVSEQTELAGMKLKKFELKFNLEPRKL
ncbi:MAG: fimbrial protein [Geobacteraceae bacterium]|nr:fimbrial protein [Geobacteraceae bacterium]